MTAIGSASGQLIAGLGTSADQWSDSFRRPNGPLGNGWIDGHDVLPTVYEPLGIYNQSVVCTNPRSRPGTYEPDQGVHPPSPPGTLYQGIGCAWRDFGTDVIRASYRYSGIWAAPTHVEGGPLLHIVPGTPEHGWGAWLTTAFDLPLICVGPIRNPPEDWTIIDLASAPNPGGLPISIELRSDGTGVTTWLNGNQVSMSTNGLDPCPLPENLLGSTLHGFCVDTHLTAEANIPTTPVIHSVSFIPGAPTPTGPTVELLASGDKGWDEMPHHEFIVTSSISPGPNCALVLLASATENDGSGSNGPFDDTEGGAHITTYVSSGSGPTWTRQAHGTSPPTSGYSTGGGVFTAVIGGSDPGSFTVTIDPHGATGGITMGGYAWAIYKITGHDSGSPFAGAVGTWHQAGNGAVTATLTEAPAVDDVTLAISFTNVDSTGSSPGSTFGSSHGTWTVDATSSGAKWSAWVVGQRTGSTDEEVDFADVNAHNGNNYDSGQAAIIVKAA